MLKNIVILLALVVYGAFAVAQVPNNLESSKNIATPAYGFYASKNRQDFKTFHHSIFGITIDVPTGWTFGINGTPPTAVILLYPEAVGVNSFSPEYEMIELGLLPSNVRSLTEAQQLVMSGMQAKHPNLVMVDRPVNIALNGDQALQWRLQWQAKSGYTIIEYITLVRDKNRIRSIDVRTARPDFLTKRKFYDQLISTVEFSQPKI